ncbi:unnamed protein product, partial [Prorocentrum cordatum]
PLLLATRAAGGTMASGAVSRAAVEEAAGRIAAYVHRTRVFTCEQISRRASEASGSPRRLFLKAEHEQKVGAFKIRGAINAICQSSADYIVTQSSGNHAQAIALGCKLLGKKAIVVMPEDSPAVKVDAVRESYGAEVRFCAPSQEAREAMSAEIVAALRKEHGAEKCEEIHPNQDVRVINGQGTVAVELLEQQPGLDAVVVSIGGGGLISGIASYVKAASSAHKSKKAGVLVKNPPNTPVHTMADSVKSSLGATTFPLVMEHVDAVFTASEEEIEAATRFTMERAKQVVEPGCGLAVAVATSARLYEAYPDLRAVGVVLCGGNVDLGNLPWMRPKRPADGEGQPAKSRRVGQGGTD